MGTTEGLEGTLLLAPGETGLDATIHLQDGHLVIETADGERESWERSVVRVGAYDTRTAELELGNSTLFFEAAEPLEFADRLAEFVAVPLKRKDRRKAAKAAKRASAPAVETPPPPESDPFAPAPTAPAVDAKRQKKRRKEHIHAWTTSSIGGGITRAVCSKCGQVSIDLTSQEGLSADPTPLLSFRPA